jgi:hypothetical protein
LVVSKSRIIQGSLQINKLDEKNNVFWDSTNQPVRELFGKFDPPFRWRKFLRELNMDKICSLLSNNCRCPPLNYITDIRFWNFWRHSTINCVQLIKACQVFQQRKLQSPVHSVQIDSTYPLSPE